MRMKKLVALSTVVLSASLITACSDEPESSELVQAYTEAREQTRTALEETKDAIKAMENNQDALEKALERLDRVAELHEENVVVSVPATTTAQ
jgi:septal ring factor EnvC (AmiA/AmiB activator)